MPHQCIKCSTTYTDEQMVMMCGCGSKAFFFLKRNVVVPEELREELLDRLDDESVVLDYEIVEGKYDIDLKSLLKKQVVTEEDEGKYSINLHEGFKRLK